MSQVRKLANIPDYQRMASEVGPFDYSDTYSVTPRSELTIGGIVQQVFALPQWVNALMEIRRLLIVKTFGLRTGKEGAGFLEPDGTPKNVVARNDDEILISQDDKHLRFWIDIAKESKDGATEITMTTFVKFHNRWGRLYFAAIKPFHGRVVRATLARL